MPSTPTQPVLVWIDAGNARQTPLSRKLTVGRAKDCDVTLDHPTVSRHHATLEIDAAGQPWVTDMGSANGTRVAGRRITGRYKLPPSTRLRFGQLTTWFYLDPAEANTPTPRPTGEEGIVFRCSHCQSRLWAGRSLVGKSVPCRKCKLENIVPEASDVDLAGETVAGLDFLDDESDEEPVAPRCGICRWPLGGRVTVCPSCSAAFHEECWTNNRGCATYGCSQVNVLEPDPGPAIPSAERPLSPVSISESVGPEPGKAWIWLAVALLGAVLGLVSFGATSLAGALACAMRIRRGGLDRPGLLGFGMAVCVVGFLAGLVVSARLWLDTDVLQG